MQFDKRCITFAYSCGSKAVKMMDASHTIYIHPVYEFCYHRERDAAETLLCLTDNLQSWCMERENI